MPAGRRACTTARSPPEDGCILHEIHYYCSRPELTGKSTSRSLRDGRVVYIGAEQVDDVTTHPAFRNGARSMAAIYDLKRAAPRSSFEEGGEPF